MPKKSTTTKLLTKISPQVMRVQRNFPYPIKQWIHQVPPVMTLKDGISLVVLTQHKTFTESLWTAYTWLYFLSDRLSLKIVMDGEVTEAEKTAFHRLFPNGQITSVSACIDEDTLSHPAIRDFYLSHKFGNPLLLKLALQRQSSILFSDPDVLVFQYPTELAQAIDQNQGCYCTELNSSAISEWIRDRATQQSLKITKDFNSGVLFIPQNSLSLETCQTLLEGWSPEVIDHFPEQTICDVLMTAAQARPLPHQEYVVNNIGMNFWTKDLDYRNLKIRHFVGNVRHRMYMSGYPLVKKLLPPKSTSS
jgi:hypothetical protein